MEIRLSTQPSKVIRCMKKVGRTINHQYDMSNGGRVGKEYGIVTEHANSCSILGLLSGNKSKSIENRLFHLAPEQQNLGNLEYEIEKNVCEMEDITNSSVDGCLFGGWKLDKKYPITVDSFNLYNSIADILDKLGIKFSMICGKNMDAPLDNAFLFNKTINLWNKHFTFLKEADENNVAKFLEQKYQFVELPSDVKIKIVNQK